MASDVILYEGTSSTKSSDIGEFIATPKAFLTDDFAGVKLDDETNTTRIESIDTGKRSLLAAIRGTLFAQELPYIISNNLPLYFCAGSNSEKEMQKIDIIHFENMIGPERFKEIKNFVPVDFEKTLSVLVKKRFPFDGEEISNEILAGRIKKSSVIEDILNENNKLDELIDNYEYGKKIKPEELKYLLDYEFYEFAPLFKPLSDEYFANFDKKNFKSVSYGSINLSGIYVLSKLKSDPKININLSLSFTNELEGNMWDLKDNPMLYAFIFLKKSEKKVNGELYTPELLQRKYGKQKFNLKHKLPFIYEGSDASIMLSCTGPVMSLSTSFKDNADKLELMHNNIKKRMDFAAHYILSSEN